MKYLTIRQINTSDEENRIKNFDKSKTELIDAENGVYGIKYRKPSKYNYFYYSEKLRGEQIEAKLRKVERLFEEAQLLQDCIDRDRVLPKRYRINNPLVECKYYYQTKLKTMNEEAAKEILRKASITGREGFFCLVSNKNLTLQEALAIYRQKDSIEKLFNSLKNEIEIRPIRVWSDRCVYGALIIVFLAQLFVSLIRFEHETLKHVSTKFIKIALMSLTLTVEFGKRASKRLIYSNFDPISQEILMENRAFA
jgi:transposase